MILQNVRDMQVGDRVMTPGGFGNIALLNDAEPEKGQPPTVSVKLEKRRELLGYNGTVYPLEHVFRVP